MSRKPISEHSFSDLCGEHGEDDGAHPADLFRSPRQRKGQHRKTLQLCQQIAETLHSALSADPDDCLRDLRVASVTPAPDASQLLVRVEPAVSGCNIDAAAVCARLAAASGRLRCDIAAAITRRRAPKLLFQFVAPPPQLEECR